MTDPKNFHDVASPNKAQPQPTSRPIIVGKPELARDPMMRGEITEKEDKQPLAAHAQPNLTPPTLTAENVATEREAELPPSELDESPSPGAISAKNEAEAEKQQLETKLNQLIDDKTYAVPVGHQKRNHRLLLIALAIIVVVGGGVAAYVLTAS